jgi:rubrerythrin
MSICSAHKVLDPNCKLCQSTPEDLFGKDVWNRMKAEAEVAGEHRCLKCGFLFYKTTNNCPLCGKSRE